MTRSLYSLPIPIEAWFVVEFISFIPALRWHYTMLIGQVPDFVRIVGCLPHVPRCSIRFVETYRV